MNKKCSKCNQTKSITEFNKNSRNKDGLGAWCRECGKQRSSQYYTQNKEKAKAYSRKYRKDHPEQVAEVLHNYWVSHSKELAEYNTQYWLKTKEDTLVSRREDRREQERHYRLNPRHRLVDNLRGRLRSALKVKSWRKNTHFSKYIGCDQLALILYLEKQFQPRMTWDNYGKGIDKWNIDHIIPLDSAKTEEELYKLCHYTNLQPLWQTDNIKKSNKVL